MAVKLFVWPIWVWLAIRKNWRAVGSSLAVVLAANLRVACFVGFDTIWHYYFRVTREMAFFYRGHEDNFSLWTIGWRIFAGTGAPDQTGVTAPPLISAPTWAPYVSLAIFLVIFLLGLRLAVRTRNFDAAFALMVCLSIVVSPIAWSPYLILMVIPLPVIVKHLVELEWPKKETELFFFSFLLLLIPRFLLEYMVRFFSLEPQGKIVPAGAALLSLIPLLALLMLLWLAARTGKISPSG